MRSHFGQVLSKRLKFILTLCGIGLVTGFWLFGLGPIEDDDIEISKQRFAPVDVIVVLTGGRGRIPVAAKIWAQVREQYPQQTLVPPFYIAGAGEHFDYRAIRHLLPEKLAQSLLETDVVIERASTNTIENAFWFATHAEKRGWNRILLVTSHYHMRRARFLFGYVLRCNPLVNIQFYSARGTLPSWQNWRQTLTLWRLTIGEYFKWLYYQTTLDSRCP